MNLKLKEGESVIKSWDYAKVKGGNENELNLTVTSDRIISTDYNKKGLDRKEIFIKDVKRVRGYLGKKNLSIGAIIGSIFLFLYGLAGFATGAMSLLGVRNLFGFSEPFNIVFAVFAFSFGVLCLFLISKLLKKKMVFALKFVLYKNIKRKEGGKMSALIPYIVSAIITFFTIRMCIFLIKKGNGPGPVIFADVAFIVLIVLWVVLFKKYPISYNKVQGFTRETETKKLKVKVNAPVANEIMQEIGAIMLDGKA